MFQLLIDGLAAFVGSFLMQRAKDRKLSIKIFFTFSFLLMVLLTSVGILISGNLEKDIILICIGISFVCALLGSLIYNFYIRQ